MVAIVNLAVATAKAESKIVKAEEEKMRAVAMQKKAQNADQLCKDTEDRANLLDSSLKSA